MKKSKITLSIICLLAFVALAADSLYSQAQKLYSQKNFEAAAKIYANVCPQLAAEERKICQFNEIKALVESNKTDLARIAEPKLLLMISQTEPNDSLFAELSAEDAKLQTMLNQPVRAVRSWNAAQASASTDYFPELFVLCQDIISAFPENGLTTESCDKVKPADTTLVSLPRKKITPLAANQPQPQPQTKPQPDSPLPTPHSQKWYIQLGAFGSKENAERLVANFRDRGVELYIVELPDRKLFTVRVGFFASAEEAKNFAEQKIAPVHSDYKIFQ
jgi:septal ring-binding cell division protein DamX